MVTLQNLVQNGLKKSSCHEVVSEFFEMNAPDPPHWSLNSHFGAFRTIRVHLGPLVALRNSVHKFVPRSRVIIFRNESSRSTPLDTKLMFWCVLYYFGAFGTVWLPYGTRCKTGRTSAKVCATKSHHNFSQRKQPIHPIGH